jgi:hypothetical protein
LIVDRHIHGHPPVTPTVTVTVDAIHHGRVSWVSGRIEVITVEPRDETVSVEIDAVVWARLNPLFNRVLFWTRVVCRRRVRHIGATACKQQNEPNDSKRILTRMRIHVVSRWKPTIR